jgi:hypothetical protein
VTVTGQEAAAMLRDLTEAATTVAGRLLDIPEPQREVTSMGSKGNDNPAKGSPREGENADKILGRGSNPKNK